MGVVKELIIISKLQGALNCLAFQVVFTVRWRTSTQALKRESEHFFESLVAEMNEWLNGNNWISFPKYQRS